MHKRAFFEVLIGLRNPAPACSRSKGSGAAYRECYRQLVLGVFNPLASLVSAELTAKISPTDISFKALAATDIQGRSRAYKALREVAIVEAEA